jgi:UDP-2,4-diacetamido-2,4,6-trideoxy-beta-L-altropyranose hydrolase
MNIVFRVDSSTQIGVGHLMRCLTLADEFQKKNHKITFICRELQGNLVNLIKYKVIGLLGNNDFQSDDLYLNLLGETQEQDAGQVIRVMPENTDLLIVDNYALDEVWHKKLRQYTDKIMVIDDLADKQFDCDILLNQNLGSQVKDYQGKVLNDCELLLGCDYALLRPEFKELRGQALEKRKNTKKIKNILISMGGSDIKNITYDVLQQLDSNFNVVVVLGSISPHNAMIENYAKDKKIKVIVNADNMAELMLEADLAIGASGSTNWERLCLGLPSLIFTVAENQIKFSKILDKLELIRLLGHVGESKVVDVVKENILLIDDLNVWSERCFNSCSCDGTSKVVEIVTSKSVLSI